LWKILEKKWQFQKVRCKIKRISRKEKEKVKGKNIFKNRRKWYTWMKDSVLNEKLSEGNGKKIGEYW
jgi:hypothetical protein